MLDYILHLDKHLQSFFEGPNGVWTYPLVTAVIFAESAFVIFPFLPGDSLVFTVGFISNFGLNIWLVGGMMIGAAILGNDVNYRIGKRFGPGLFEREGKFFNRTNLEKTNDFFDRYGARAVVLARFVPFVRSFVPFVAGMADMDYRKFTRYNIVGGVAWIAVFLVAGNILGKFEFIRKNLEYAVPLIILVTLLPMYFEVRRHKKEAAKKRAQLAARTASAEASSE